MNRSRFTWTRAALLIALAAFLMPSGTWAGEVQKKDDYFGFFAGAGFGDEEFVGKQQGDQGNPLVGLRWDHFVCWDRGFFADAAYLDYDSTLPIGDTHELSGRFGVQKLFGKNDGANVFLEGGLGVFRLYPENVENKQGVLIGLGFGQRFLLGKSATMLRWEIRPEVFLDSFAPGGGNMLLWKATIGWSWGVGGPFHDKDGDGVPDCEDQCDGTPSGAVVDAKGCPKDSDGDGVYDGLDRCPDTPRGWRVDSKGCPVDSDGDGVPDGADKCPNTPAGAKVDATGCPTDADGDGVYDGIDKCPDTPRGAKVDASGCPLDSDGDGVYDGIDKCPNTPRGTKVDATGCPIAETPKAPPVFEPGKTSLILEGVNFETDKAVLTPDSLGVLDRVAASLRDWPDVKIEVDGHTDADGADAYNQKLSERRATAVEQYLADHGVAMSRMSVKGYGESKPIADNKTKEGKAKNRRVELTKSE